MSDKIRGVTIPIGADTTEFNKAVRKMDSSIRSTQSQVRALENALKIEWDPKKFEQAQKLAQKAITDTESKAKALKDQLKYMDETGVDPNNERYQRLSAQLVRAEADAVRLKKQLDDINQIKIDRIVNGFKNVGDAISKAGKALAPFSAAAAGVLAGLGAMFKDSKDAAAALDDMRQEVNMSAEALQKWQYIAAQQGLDTATLQNSLIRTQQGFSKLTIDGTGPAAEALQALGFTAAEAARGMDANYEIMLSRLAAVEDATTQAYLANEIFGNRMGAKIIPMLNGGAAGLKELTAEFEALGYMTEEQITALADFDDELLRIRTAFNSVKNELAVALLPVMESLTNVVKERMLPAFQQLSEWFSSFSDSGRKTIVTILGIVAALAPALLIVGKLTTGLGAMIGTLAKLPQLLTTLAAHPIIAIIGVIAALVMALYSSNEQFRESINGLVGVLGDALAPILEIVMEIFGQLMEVVMPIINMLGSVLTPIVGVLGEALQTVGTVIQAILMPILSALQPMITMMIQLIMPLIDILTKALVPAIEFVAKIFSKVFGFIHNIMNSFLKGLEGVFNKAIGLINGLIKGINKLGGWLGISLKELDKVKLTVESKNSEAEYKSETAPSTTVPKVPSAVDTALNQQTAFAPITTVINNNQDNSNKNVTIGPGAVVIQNYAAEADVEDMADKIMVMLAEGM